MVTYMTALPNLVSHTKKITLIHDTIEIQLIKYHSEEFYLPFICITIRVSYLTHLHIHILVKGTLDMYGR